MPSTQSTALAEFGKRGIRFALTLLGLALLRGLGHHMPVLETAPTIGNTLLTPGVLIDAILDTLIITSIVRFGIVARHALAAHYPRVPDLSRAVWMGALLVAFLVAYDSYQTPIAAAIAPLLASTTGEGTEQPELVNFFDQINGAVQTMAAEAGPGVATVEAALARGVAVARLRQSPDVYGWAFLLFTLLPVLELVRLAWRNLDAVSEALWHKAAGMRSAARPSARDLATRPLAPETKGAGPTFIDISMSAHPATPRGDGGA